MHAEATNRASRRFFRTHRLSVSALDEIQFAVSWNAVARKYNRLYLDGILSFRDHVRMRLQALFEDEITSDEADRFFEEYLVEYEKGWRLHADVRHCLEALKQNRLGIISNGSSEYQRKKLRVLGIHDRFDTIVISEEIGISKPDKAIFTKACEIAGVRSGECSYVGDRLENDIRPAIEAGMRGVWLNRNQIAGGILGVVSITSLSELPDALK